jgi:predicted SnoaL-like aldol condensation-catalyzing enzyme
MKTFLIPSLSLALLLAAACASDDGSTAPSEANVNGGTTAGPVSQQTMSVQPTVAPEQTPAVASPPGAEAAPSEVAPSEPPLAMGALQPALPVLENPNHELLLSSTVPALASNKRLVYDLWRTLIEARDTQAAQRYLAEGYIQHNPNADTGRAGVLAYFGSLGAPLAVQERVQAKLVSIVAERDYVAMVRVDEYQQPRPYTTTWFDLFRIEAGLIAEHWDHGRLPAGGTARGYVPPAENGDQEAALASDTPQLASNKRLVHDMWRTLLDAQQVEEAPRFLAPGYVQHNPQANTGLQGFLTFFRQFAQPRPLQPGVAGFIQMIAEGDLVVLATVRRYDDASAPYTTTWFDMFRVNEGLLVEHWDTATLPPQ